MKYIIFNILIFGSCFREIANFFRRKKSTDIDDSSSNVIHAEYAKLGKMRFDCCNVINIDQNNDLKILLFKLIIVVQ